MDKQLKDRLPLIEVKELTWAQALRLMTKPIELAQEPKVEPQSFPYGEQAVAGKKHTWR